MSEWIGKGRAKKYHAIVWAKIRGDTDWIEDHFEWDTEAEHLAQAASFKEKVRKLNAA